MRRSGLAIAHIVAVAILAVFVGVSCVAYDDSTNIGLQTEEGSVPPGNLEGHKIEGSDIGVVGLEVDLGSVTVVFEEWVPKDGEADEYVGFTLSVDGIPYRVKTGGEIHPADTASWIHPNGTGGPDVPAISNIDFPDGPDPDDPGPDDPEPPPSGDEPDAAVIP